MNKTFKTIWNEARRSYIVTNEAQKTHGKPSKCAVALAVAATAFLSMGAANAAYVEPGFTATSTMDVDAAVASWETDEYMANWGLVAQKASSAYALGYYGQGVKVGQMDSGILKGHVELSGDRWHVVSASGEYTHDGERYPQYAYPDADADTGAYKAGDKFSVDGYYDPEINDGHGTGCAGVYAGNRDGQGMHGVAWGSEFYSANSGGTDDSNYGPFPDYGFFKAGYDALVNAGVKIINNSWGTNLKQVNEENEIVDYYHSGPELTTVQDIEYEYFMFKRNYNEGPSFVDAAWDAIKGKDVIQAFSAGNNDRATPYHRGLYPYFNPEAEDQWLVVSGLRQVSSTDDPYNFKLEENFNEAGFAKYWTLSAPGQNGRTSNVSGTEAYGGYSGTSMATPFVSGAFAVLASRYTDMSAVQVRQVLLTTANHKNADGTNMIGWDNADGTTPLEGQVSDRMGWGVPDLEKGMYGLGQLFGHFDYNLQKGHLDVWSNDISQVALDQRYAEDMAWLDSATDENGDLVISDDPNDYKLTNTSTGEANADGKEHNYDLAGVDNKDVTLEEAMKWREEYYQKRLDSIQEKLDEDFYSGTLTKSGEGTLVLLGDNSYKGTTTVKGGTLLAFSESIGDDNKVTVEAEGTFGVLSSYNDNFTMTGVHTSKATEEDKLTIDLTAGGTLLVDAASNVEVAKVDFGDSGTKNVVVGLVGADTEQLAKAYKGEAEFSGSITSDADDFTDVKPTTMATDSAFFTVGKSEVSTDGKTLSVGVESNGKKVADFAQGKNATAIATALENGPANGMLGTVLTMTGDQVTDALTNLSDDMYSAARNAFAVNSLTVSRTVIEQARSYGEGRAAEFENGRGRVWIAGVGQWMNADGANSSLNVDFGAGFVGAEWIATENTKVGAYFGYGATKYEGASGKIDGDDMHYGIYGLTDIGPVGLTYGIGYTTEDRDSIRTFAGTANAHSEDATALQVFAEAAYNDFYIGSVNVAPYIGYEWMRIETDGFTESALGQDFRMGDVEDDLQVATIGARVTVPVTVGKMPVALKANVGYSRFFGDTESVTSMQLGHGGAIASIEGEELEGQVNFGLGVTAQIGKRATVGINYTGAYGSDTDTHGIGAALRINF
ncbi:MAG TPA: autotransporter domain-containing protein [Candidatus Aphodousia gallistercoris]|nr:autotransporter domain-containing protein [Candidatus Aphodousia gallistercoris]